MGPCRRNSAAVFTELDRGRAQSSGLGLELTRPGDQLFGLCAEALMVLSGICVVRCAHSYILRVSPLRGKASKIASDIDWLHAGPGRPGAVSKK